MAKKKTDTPSAPKTTAEKKAPAKKAAAKPAAAANTGMPMIDTNHAAQAAAKMLVARPNAQSSTAPKLQSSAFKNMKDLIAKPKSASLGHLLGDVTQAKKPGGHFNQNQKGHNQTLGGMNKTGVPRRTGGG